MEKVVQALVQDRNGNFAVVADSEGRLGLPTCMIDVGASFKKAVFLREGDVSVEPVGHLGFDPEISEHYYLCEAKGSFAASTGKLGLQWMKAQDVLRQPLKTTFRPVINYIRAFGMTREAA